MEQARSRAVASVQVKAESIVTEELQIASDAYAYYRRLSQIR